MEDGRICCICGQEYTGLGNNPYPVISDEDARCCDKCNIIKVIPARLEELQNKRIRDRDEACKLIRGGKI